ncbi:hypothetical protein [Desulfotignum phosphitoxidans]|nr:hypothetical protein [Desulfotignum phosphitoxidans]
MHKKNLVEESDVITLKDVLKYITACL